MSPDIFTLDAVEEFVEQFTNVDNSGTILGIRLFGNLNQLVKMLLTIRVKLETDTQMILVSKFPFTVN